MWYNFRQWLIEHYSSVLYMSVARYIYSHLSQGDEEPTTQDLSRAKVLLKPIHHTTKLSNIPGVGLDNLYLVRGLMAHVIGMSGEEISEPFKEYFPPNIKSQLLELEDTTTAMVRTRIPVLLLKAELPQATRSSLQPHITNTVDDVSESRDKSK